MHGRSFSQRTPDVADFRSAPDGAHDGFPAGPFDTGDHDAFLAALRSRHDDAALAFAREAIGRRGIAIEDVLLHLLPTAAHRLGMAWEEDTCEFTEVAFGMGRLQRVLRELAHEFTADRTGPGGAVMICCGAREHHTFGAFVLAEFFVRDGWDVTLGPPFLADDVFETARQRWFDAVCVSVARDGSFGETTRLIARLRRVSRNRALVVLAGGRAVLATADAARRLGADGVATDAAQGVHLARTCVAAAQPGSAPAPRGLTLVEGARRGSP